ncbi:MAG: hypothetical protein CMJ64_00100 [Planctomycetaceae bacterium]|nr:hypothetical protein [Planctomycetaceae bacterium]
MKRLSLLFAVTLVLSSSRCLLAQPSLSYSAPAAAQPGQTIELTLHGGKLDDPLQVWTSFPAKVELLPGPADAKDQANRKCKVTLDGNVPVGIGGLIVGSPAGVSDVLLVMVDDLASVADSGKNHSLAEAQLLTVPVAVDGVADGAIFDYYKFAGKKDQRLSVEVVATRLSSSLDSVVRLLKADGSELILSDDDVSLGAESRLSLTLPEDGEYVLELHDNQYRAGGRYRLRVGDFPLVTVPVPLGGRLGSTVQLRFAGPASDGAAPLLLRIPDEVATGRVSVAARFPEGKSSGLATLVATELPEALEVEPNDANKVATPVTVPAAINGSFQAEGDRDYFTFAALKDQSLSFRARSQSLGSPSLVFIRIYNEAGNQLVETAVNDGAEWTLTYKFPADGMYCVAAEDLLHRGGPEHAYRVEIQPSGGFSLAVKNDKNTRLQFKNPVNGGAFALVVTCTRQGYDGVIDLAIEGSPPGYRLLNPTIPAKAKEHRLLLVVSDGAKAGDLRAIRLLGKAQVGDRAYTAVVETQATVRGKRPQLLSPPEWMNGLLSTVVGAESAAFYGTKLNTEAVTFAQAAGKAEFAFTLERTNAEFKDAVTVLFEQLPAGFSGAVKADKDTYNITLTGPKDAAPGKHTIRLVSYGEFKGTGQVLITEVPVEIKAEAPAS